MLYAIDKIAGVFLKIIGVLILLVILWFLITKDFSLLDNTKKIVPTIPTTSYKSRLSFMPPIATDTGKEKKENPIVEKQTTFDAFQKRFTPKYLGIDISRYQGNLLNEIDTKQTDIGFVFMKATEGNGYSDPKFIENWNAAAHKNIPRGAYHFYRTEADPVDQAYFFLETMGALNSKDLPPVLDIEGGSLPAPDEEGEAPIIDKAAIISDLKIWLKIVAKQTNKTPIIYASPGFADTYLTDAEFSDYTLWIAHYEEDEPRLPKIWKDKEWKFWQQTQSMRLGKYTVNANVFAGDKKQFEAFMAEN
jgi:lysozyme